MQEACDIVISRLGCHCRTCDAVWDPDNDEVSPCEARRQDGLSYAAVIGLGLATIAGVALVSAAVRAFGASAIALAAATWGG